MLGLLMFVYKKYVLMTSMELSSNASNSSQYMNWSGRKLLVTYLTSLLMLLSADKDDVT